MVASLPLIYVIRHGQTDWNAQARFQGGRNIPLNATGQNQATHNGLNLKLILAENTAVFDYVASPLVRARETMERIRASMNLPISDFRVDDRLIEVSFGDWEGHTLEELQSTVANRVADRALDKWNFLPPGDQAESYEIMSWRISAWLNEVTQPTVCVCHGGVIRALFKIIAGIDGHAAADLATPQDQILKIEGDQIEWIASPI